VPGGSIEVRLAQEGNRLICSFIAVPLAALADDDAESKRLPEDLLALAEAEQAEMALHGSARQWRLDISLPAAQLERTIAVIEDNEDLVTLFSRYLAGRSYRLVPIGGGAEAIERLREVQPDAIVLDLMMPDVDGWEVLQQVKADPLLRDLPVVVCSVLNEPELAMSLGADAYLHKPVRPADAYLHKPVRPATLLECVEGLLRR